jgi:hypothetical protein
MRGGVHPNRPNTFVRNPTLSQEVPNAGRTPATCKLGEVAWTSPMQEGAASESSPREAHVVQGLGPGPLHEGLFANLEQHSTARRWCLAHMICTPL